MEAMTFLLTSVLSAILWAIWYLNKPSKYRYSAYCKRTKRVYDSHNRIWVSWYVAIANDSDFYNNCETSVLANGSNDAALEESKHSELFDSSISQCK